MLSFSWINLRKPWWHSVGVGSSPYVVQVSHCLSCVEVHILWYGSDANENGKNFDFDSSLLASWRWEIVSANQCYCYWVFSVTVLSLSSHRNTKCKMQLAVLFEMCHTLCIVAHTNTNACTKKVSSQKVWTSIHAHKTQTHTDTHTHTHTHTGSTLSSG